MAHPFPANRRAQMRMCPSARLDRRPDGGLKVGDGEGLLQERCGPKGPRLGPRVLIGERRDQDEGHGAARALEGRQHVQPTQLGQLVVRDDGVVGALVTNGDTARRQSVLVHRGREVLQELGAIARLDHFEALSPESRAEQTPRIGVVLRQQEPSLAWGGLGRLEQDSTGRLGNARGCRLLIDAPILGGEQGVLADLVPLAVRVTRRVPKMPELMGPMIRLPSSLGHTTQDGVDVDCKAGARENVRRGESIKEWHDPPPPYLPRAGPSACAMASASSTFDARSPKTAWAAV